MAEHNTLTGSQLHEPKGADSAASNAVYVANGTGSGTWTVQYTLNKVYLAVDIDDVSTAGSYWVVPGFSGTIDKITTVLHGTIATADAGLSFEIGGTAVTDGGITIAFSGSNAGDVDSSSPTAANSFTAAQPIEIITDGASTNTVKVTVTFELSRTA